jgi:hypothetical protein
VYLTAGGVRDCALKLGLTVSCVCRGLMTTCALTRPALYPVGAKLARLTEVRLLCSLLITLDIANCQSVYCTVGRLHKRMVARTGLHWLYAAVECSVPNNHMGQVLTVSVIQGPARPEVVQKYKAQSERGCTVHRRSSNLL